MPFFHKPLPKLSREYQAIVDAYYCDETECIKERLQSLALDLPTQSHIQDLARELVTKAREGETDKTGIEALMMHYDLSTEEGILLMCLAEALLRIPDKETEDLLIRDKLTSANWEKHLGLSQSSFVNMATWGLALTGKVLRDPSGSHFKTLWKNLVKRSGEPVIRQAVREAIKVMSHQFVIGRNMQEAFERSKSLRDKGYSFSYDMLGEAAHTMKDADKYFEAYKNAIQSLGSRKHGETIFHGPSISVKLSALHPRYEFMQQEVCIPFLIERMKELMRLARELDIALTIDAEEADRLGVSLMIIDALLEDPEFKGWDGLGLAVQAYQKRAYPVIEWLISSAKRHKKRIPVRLVKGAYWDSQIKLAQEEGAPGYPVFTRKTSTDVSYLACAKLMLTAQKEIYPQFATHNAYSVAAILSMMDDYREYDFEFQNLQGMGKSLHDQLVAKDGMNIPCRVYAPVGSHEDLLPYLVRRLLENGANSSFVNKIADSKTLLEDLIQSPIAVTEALYEIPHPKIPLPKHLYGEARVNSQGIDFSDQNALRGLSDAMHSIPDSGWTAAIKDKNSFEDQGEPVASPADRRHVVGHVQEATADDVEVALVAADKAFFVWDGKLHEERVDVLLKTADLLEIHRPELIKLARLEAGKTLVDAVSEVREAVDFCRYYAVLAKTTLTPEMMPGPTGETNILRMRGRGVIACISPWNFPIAIFTGQVAAALVTGNTVIAKPAEQTPLVAARVVELFYEAGVPKDVLQLLPGQGDVVGSALVEDERVAGVVFTGSTATAKHIQRSLAAREGAIVPLIAETGGINAMIVDSTALPEQLIADVVRSAFGSAGQRCSALRVLFLQDDIADRTIEMLKGAMEVLTVGDPQFLQTDVGPVIDKDAQVTLQKHVKDMMRKAQLIYRVELPREAQHGTFVAPHAFELPDLSMLTKEVFGPILHVVRYKRSELNQVIDAINNLGYGLTFGIESRIDETVGYIQSRINAGNIYVNRNMIGAVVGVQPFGGNGLSGTGPKAGGPHYLARLCAESTLTINTTAAGGNASLMAMD